MESLFKAKDYPSAIQEYYRRQLTGLLCHVVVEHRQPSGGFVMNNVIDGQHEVVHNVNQ
jgi:hypothetical protein